MSLQDLSTQTLFNVKDKIALVTGGGSGIGKMVAAGLVANGAKVYIAARKEAQLKAAADELNAVGPGKCLYIVADLSNKAGCDALVGEFKMRETKLHILVNNSGVTWGAPYDNFPEKEGWDRVLAVNVKSIFYMTAGLTDLLAKDATSVDPGRIINISSVAGVSPHAEEGIVSDKGNGTWSYHTSKAAANHLTSQLAVTLSRKFITVNAILPGIFPSKMTAFGFKKNGLDKMNSVQPFGKFPPSSTPRIQAVRTVTASVYTVLLFRTGRVGAPTDMAGLALFLCSPASAYVTGAQILLDGGATLVKTKASL